MNFSRFQIQQAIKEKPQTQPKDQLQQTILPNKNQINDQNHSAEEVKYQDSKVQQPSKNELMVSQMSDSVGANKNKTIDLY